MPDEKQSNFKVTDRRKFNADGSIRESEGQVTEAASPQEKPGSPAFVETESRAAQGTVAAEGPIRQPERPSDARVDNVVSFPGQAQVGGQGTAASSATAAQATAQTASTQTPQQKAAEQAYAQHSAAQSTQMPPANFLAIVNMLGIEAAMHLGMVQVPGHEETHIDLEAARHMIDLLAVLQQKTRGNLSPEEDRLMENLLADLRMQFVSLSQAR